MWYHCAALARSVVRSALFAVVAIVLTAAPSFAQTPTVSPVTSIPKAPSSWTFYMAIATIGIAALTVIMFAIGYLVQAPGFRRGQRAGQTS